MTHRHTLQRGGLGRRGFSLIENVVTITVMAVAVVGMAPMLVATARQATLTQANQYRAAAMSALVSRYGAASFGSLTVGSTCTAHVDATDPLPRTECVSITDSAGVLRVVTIVVTPADSARVRSDAMVMRRVRTLVTNPLNAP